MTPSYLEEGINMEHWEARATYENGYKIQLKGEQTYESTRRA